MAQEFNIKHIDHYRNRLHKWFAKKTQTTREIIFPVPVSIARNKLQAAFAGPINISNGFLFTRFTYAGQVNETAIHVQFTEHGRGKIHYSMQGQLFPTSTGSCLLMVVKNENPMLFFVSPIIIFCFVLYNWNTGFIIFATIFLMICFPVMAWHRNSAAHNLSSLVYKIVCAQN